MNRLKKLATELALFNAMIGGGEKSFYDYSQPTKRTYNQKSFTTPYKDIKVSKHSQNNTIKKPIKLKNRISKKKK